MDHNENEIVLKVCSKCHNGFILGVGGFFVDEDTLSCDTCAGVERDAEGNAWLPDETEIVWEDGTVTTRAEAFAK